MKAKIYSDANRLRMLSATTPARSHLRRHDKHATHYLGQDCGRRTNYILDSMMIMLYSSGETRRFLQRRFFSFRHSPIPHLPSCCGQKCGRRMGDIGWATMSHLSWGTGLPTFLRSESPVVQLSIRLNHKYLNIK